MKEELIDKITNSPLVTTLKAVYLFIPGLIFLALYYFIIVKISIGQDMLMQATESASPYIWTIVSLLSWMLFSWFSSRLVAGEYVSQCKPPHRKIFEHFPRLIGYNVAVCLQLAILNLPTVAALTYGFYVLLALHNAYYFLLSSAFQTPSLYKKKKRKLLILSLSVASAYIIYLIDSFPKDMPIIDHVTNENRHLRGSFFMAILFFIFQIAFVAFVVWRRKQIDESKLKDSRAWRTSYDWFAGIILLLYIIILVSPKFANSVGALGITLLAFGLWVGFICVLKFNTIRFSVHFWLPLLFFAITYGLIWKHTYDVRLQKDLTGNLSRNRLNIDGFFYKWVNNPLRKDALSKDSNTTYTAYLILADGGASKSGYWVAAVLSKLEESSVIADKFSSHLFSLAGASGGSVGNAAFYSLLKHQLNHHQVDFTKESRLFFEADFFSSSFARFLGPDLFRHVIPFISMDDRAAVLEKSMESNSNSEIIGSYFKGSIDTVLDRQGYLPALFINTTNLQSGSPGVVSNIELDSTVTERMDILKLLDTATKLGSNRGIRLSTSVVLGARFPYISPAGEIAGKYFVDGGYFDNSGAGITLEVLQYIQRKMNDSTNTLYRPYKNKLAFKVIYISNGIGQATDHELNPLVNDAAAPLLTVLGTYGMQTNLANKKLSSFMNNTKSSLIKNSFEALNLPMAPLENDDSIVPYPMNWVISKYNLDRMKKNIERIHPKAILQQ